MKLKTKNKPLKKLMMNTSVIHRSVFLEIPSGTFQILYHFHNGRELRPFMKLLKMM